MRKQFLTLMKIAGVVTDSCLFEEPRGGGGAVVVGVLEPLLGAGLAGVSARPRDS